MKNPDFEQDLRVYGGGARPDIESEILSQNDQGHYVDAYNMRSDATKGSKGSAEKAGFVQVISGPATPDTNFFCIGSVAINDQKVSCWVHKSGASNPYIDVDGIVVAQSADLGFVYGENFDIDVNPNCVGGEIFIACEDFEPVILNVGDMISSLSSDPTKYFTNFQRGSYSINLAKPLDIPVLVNVPSVGAGAGLRVGKYRYAIRYRTGPTFANQDELDVFSGDATEWSPYTPYIPVPVIIGSPVSPIQYPYNGTIGSAPSLFPTNYGIALRFRCTNLLNYDIIEVKRQAENAGAAVGVVPEEKLITQIPISHGEIKIIEFTDPSDATVDLILSPQEAQAAQFTDVTTCKALRYFQKRLWLFNVSKPSKEASVNFLTGSAGKIYSCIQSLGKAGMKDPYNCAYYQPYMNGEKFSFGSVLFDGIGNPGFVQEDSGLKNFQIPNRRDELSDESKAVSYLGWATATKVNNIVGATHEVFDLSGAVRKFDKCSFKNIFEYGSFSLPFVKENYGRFKDEVNVHSSVGLSPTCAGSNSEIQSQGASIASFPPPFGAVTGFAVGSRMVHPGYSPYHPTQSIDSDQSGHNYITNPNVWKTSSSGVNNATPSAYAPTGFAPNYYSTGVVIQGITGIPSWVKALSIVRSAPAGRVVCQGIGWYKMNEADFMKAPLPGNNGLGGKESHQFWFHSQDLMTYSGTQIQVDPNLIADMNSNPSAYKIQLVSPLGFFSEVYNFEAEDASGAPSGIPSTPQLLTGNRDRLIDMISYARILSDNGQINPGERGDMGYSDGNGNRYVGFGKWRGNQNPSFSGSNNGNRTFQLASVAQVDEGNGTYFTLGVEPTGDAIYLNETTGASSIENAGFNEIHQFHEPVYIVNIIQDKDVPDRNQNEYIATGHYQKIESIIGVGTGLSGQTQLLVDERWEDCIPALSQFHSGAAGNSYIYIRRSGQASNDIWVNVTYKTASQKTTIQNDINANGFWDPGDGTQVVGMYRHTSEGTTYDPFRFHTLVFDQLDNFPANGAHIIVRYDSTKPIRVFGGNITIADNIFAPLDKEARGDNNSENKNPQFEWGVGLPFNQWAINGRHYIIKRLESSLAGLTPPKFYTQGSQELVVGASFPVVIRETTCFLSYIRQLAVMYTCQTRSPMHYSFGNHYPQRHYVMRPNRDDGVNHIFPTYYDTDYVGEPDVYRFGGFKCKPLTNIDYMKEPPVEYFSKPKVGFVEQNEFCTRVQWSKARETNERFSPSLRTFDATSYIDLSDEFGEIKRAYSATTSKGENLYAITERGICLLITEKAILSDLNSDEIGLFADKSTVLGQYWISKNTGIEDELQRCSVEADATFKTNSGTIRRESLFFINRSSLFRLTDNTLTDLAEGQFASVINPMLQAISEGYLTDLTMGYDYEHDELYVGIDNEDVLVYNHKDQSYVGRFGFRADSYLSIGKDTWAFYGKQIMVLNSGDVAFDSLFPPQSWVIQVSGLRFFESAAYINLQINSSHKPFQVHMLEADRNNPLNFTIIGIVNQDGMNDYGAYEMQIPRRIDNGDIIHARVLAYKILSDASTDRFRIISSRLAEKKRD